MLLGRCLGMKIDAQSFYLVLHSEEIHRVEQQEEIPFVSLLLQRLFSG